MFERNKTFGLVTINAIVVTKNIDLFVTNPGDGVSELVQIFPHLPWLYSAHNLQTIRQILQAQPRNESKVTAQKGKKITL